MPNLRFRQFGAACLDALLPDQCVLCQTSLPQRHPSLACSACRDALPHNASCCIACADPLSQPGLCGRCQQAPLVSGYTIAPLLHHGAARALVHRLKFAHGAREGRTLAHIIERQVRVQVHYQHAPLPSLLLPMPLSPLREAQRGYNQADYLARHIGRALHIKVQYGTWRRAHRPPQQSLEQRKRRQLSSRVFKRLRAINATHVAIIDDVLTTGRSVQALAATMQHSNVARVDVWCATRAPSTIIARPSMLE